MIPIETYYSNVVFSTESCKNLHGTLIHNEDSPYKLKTFFKLSEEKLRYITQTGCSYLYTMVRWLPLLMLSVTSKIDTEDRFHG